MEQSSSPAEVVKNILRGINMGNTLEPPFEGAWNNAPVQEYYFDDYKAAGFQCVRIPVRWNLHTEKIPPYTIDYVWLDRIEQIVDWGLSRGLYIILNAHHENWFTEHYASTDNLDRFEQIWNQIADHFKDKSNRLLFEILNEPHGMTIDQVNDMNERVLRLIRITNPTRIVIFTGNDYSQPDCLISVAVPNDKYIMATFHLYNPQEFAFGKGDVNWGSETDILNLRNEFDKVAAWASKHNIPVLLGEFGALHTVKPEQRKLFYTEYVKQALSHGFAFAAWDNGGDFRIYERDTRTWNYLKDILINTH